jgi:uncharacterized protein (DUF305 family)
MGFSQRTQWFSLFTEGMAKHAPARKVALVTTLIFGLSSLGASTINIGTGPTSQPTSTPQSSEYSQQDLMFAQMMIPHHEQALEMSVLALANSTNVDLRDLAQRIYDGQAPEIEQMRGWLDSSPNRGGMSHRMPDGTMMDNHMMGSDNMAGMASEEELAELKSLSSPEFDDLFLRLMIDHHEGALAMVRMIENSSNEEVRALAQEITVTQRAEIEEMNTLLATLTSSED